MTKKGIWKNLKFAENRKMGFIFSRIFNGLFGKSDMQILILGNVNETNNNDVFLKALIMLERRLF